jgi:hypothetical protein
VNLRGKDSGHRNKPEEIPTHAADI